MTAVQDTFDQTAADLARARASIENVIIGQRAVVDLALTVLLAGGHALFVGLPGLGKTKLAQTLSDVFGLSMKRVQCTPDLMPADITGSEVLKSLPDGGRHFEFVKGPVFCQYLMADEINRASPRTQSALLQAMQEGIVTAAGVAHLLPRPFHVMATQNPLEHEGTYPLPEAQLDRFLLQIDVNYPDEKDERKIILETTGTTSARPSAVFTPEKLIAAQDLVRSMPVGEKTVDSIIALVRACRPETSPLETIRQHVAWGPGPRAGQALMLAVRARALLDGRAAPSLDDVEALALQALGHRMALKHSARAGKLGVADAVGQAVTLVISGGEAKAPSCAAARG